MIDSFNLLSFLILTKIVFSTLNGPFKLIEIICLMLKCSGAAVMHCENFQFFAMHPLIAGRGKFARAFSSIRPMIVRPLFLALHRAERNSIL